MKHFYVNGLRGEFKASVLLPKRRATTENRRVMLWRDGVKQNLSRLSFKESSANNKPLCILCVAKWIFASGPEAVRNEVLSGYICWQTQRITFILFTAGDDFTHALSVIQIGASKKDQGNNELIEYR